MAVILAVRVCSDNVHWDHSDPRGATAIQFRHLAGLHLGFDLVPHNWQPTQGGHDVPRLSRTGPLAARSWCALVNSSRLSTRRQITSPDSPTTTTDEPFTLVVLIPDIADELFHEVFHRDDSAVPPNSSTTIAKWNRLSRMN